MSMDSRRPSAHPSNGSLPRPLSAARPSIVDHPMYDGTERDELDSPRPPATPSTARKRKKAPDGDGEPVRRLRRSHEACTRCRLKKIKCDSGHPSCSACAAVGAPCQQEDRHRNKFQPRAHQEIIEAQLTQTVAILRKYIPDYDPNRAHFFAAKVGVTIPDLPPAQPTPLSPPTLMMLPYSPSQTGSTGSDSYVLRSPVDSNMSPSTPPTPFFRPPSFTTFPNPAQATQETYSDVSSSKRELETDNGQKGLDPRGRNMANPEAIARNFGVMKGLIRENPIFEPLRVENEDMPLNSTPSSINPRHWERRPFKKGALPSPSQPASELDLFYLPTNRKIASHMIEMYFTRLNFHRPIFERNDFNRRFDLLYSPDTVAIHDPGFICSAYLVLALATLSEVHQPDIKPSWLADLKSDWPTHEEFLVRALAIKPELRVTISTLQALLLLQWYLYSERHSRSLWRLVGTLVRLAVELGLHHDPMQQAGTFTQEECSLRVNLWHSVMIHDRGTSVLLGRPVAIGEEYFNTSNPQHVPGVVSWHFVHSAPLNSIAADIIHSLYRADVQPTEEVIAHSRRILINMSRFRKSLPTEYYPFFDGTLGWSEKDKQTLRNGLTTEKGLTFLKYGIQRLLLLRAVFTNDEMRYDIRIKALQDAIKTGHNVIIMHASLTSIPDIGFFVSPLPLHLAAITIIYGQTCGFTTLSYETGFEDVNSALHIIPALRWQWERKDASGGVHPITLELANRVFKRKPPASDQPKLIPDFLPEEDWEDDSARIPPDAHTQLDQWPTELFLAGPAWPDRHHIVHTRGDGSGSSTSASPVGSHAAPHASITNGSSSSNTAIAGPSMPGANTSYFKEEGVDIGNIFAQIPGYAYGAIHMQPESELQELFMQEEKDPMARPQWSRNKPDTNLRLLEQMQHMGYRSISRQQYPSSSAQPGSTRWLKQFVVSY